MAVEAVADSGPLIAFARIGRLDLLAELDRCWITCIDALLDECLARRVARRRGVGVFGLGALRIRSEEGGRLDVVRAMLDRLAEIGHRLSPTLRTKLVELAGE
ncbi:MAG: hypothetical protein AAGE94_22050, partial [Acidobacteriota bacterium]